jgi:hypothetical protein
MKIYFSQVPHSDIDNFGDEGLLGPNKHGDFFYNQVEYGTNPGGTDEVAISDGCGRYIPISVETIPELIEVLEVFYNTNRQLKLLDQVLGIVESNTEGYIHDNYVQFDRESVQEVIDSVGY